MHMIILAALAISQPADMGAFIPKRVAMPLARPVDAKTDRVRCYIITDQKRFTVGPLGEVRVVAQVKVISRCN